MAGRGEEKTLLVVGKVGDGKSATCNSIIGDVKFKSTGDNTSVTRACQSELVEVQEQRVTVVDSPGLAEIGLPGIEKNVSTIERLEEEVQRVLAMNSKGFDAILIVIRYGRRLTEEDKKVFSQLDDFFGQGYAKRFGILIVTHSDNYNPQENKQMTFEEFLENQVGIFKDLREKCNNHMVVFDNNTKDESIKQSQVKRLLDMVAEMSRGSNRYTPEAFKNAQQQRNKAIVLANKELIDSKTQNELNTIKKKLQGIPSNTGDALPLAELKGELQALHTSLVVQDKGSGILSDTITIVVDLKSEIDKRIQATKASSQNDAMVQLMTKLMDQQLRRDESRCSLM